MHKNNIPLLRIVTFR